MAFEEQKRILPQLIKLARENEVGLVATNDCPLHQPGGQRAPRVILVHPDRTGR